MKATTALLGGSLELRPSAGTNLGTWARTIHLKRLNGKWALTESSTTGDGPVAVAGERQILELLHQRNDPHSSRPR